MATKKQTETKIPKAKVARAPKPKAGKAPAVEKPARPKRATKPAVADAPTPPEAAPEPTPQEKPRSWTRPAEETNVAANADVDDTDSEAPPNPPKPKKERPPKEELVVFAFRLTQAERDAIHATAGPRNATQFVRRVAVAFAREDDAAFKTVLAEARAARP